MKPEPRERSMLAQPRPTLPHAIACQGFLLLCGLVASPSGLPGSPGDNVSEATGPTLETHLVYTEWSHPLRYIDVQLQPQSRPFAKEPESTRPDAYRALLQVGSDRSHPVPLLWDFRAGTLYLDLNRNRDLTDDADGVLHRQDDGFGPVRQVFTNLSLTFPTDPGPHRQLLDLTLYRFRQDIRSHAQIKSFWDGKISLDGRDWQIGLIEGSNDQLGQAAQAYLLLRPWEEREEPFSAMDGTLQAFPIKNHLYFRNRSYQVGITYERQDDAPAFKVTLTPTSVSLGAFQVEGENIHRLVLANGDTAVVLDHPEKLARVPQGSYPSQEVHLRAGSFNAHRTPGFVRVPEAKVGGAEPARLRAGGPLTNVVLVEQRGRQLSLSYKLRGTDGHEYQLIEGENRKAPQFAVYKEGKKITSGRFEFG